MPNDEKEQGRLDLTHHMMRILLHGELHLCPLAPNPQRILDVGTGTGIWAMDAADMYPSAEVIGTDLSPIQPGFVPPNCRFLVDDCEEDWTFEKDSFDMVHMRHLSQSIKDWPRLLAQAYEYVFARRDGQRLMPRLQPHQARRLDAGI